MVSQNVFLAVFTDGEGKKTEWESDGGSIVEGERERISDPEVTGRPFISTFNKA